MAYLKLQASQVFDGYQLHANKVLVITPQGRIEAVVNAGTLSENDPDVQHFEGWLCPGFVNAHCHTELSHMKGAISMATGMVPFLQQVMLGRNAEKSVIERCQQLAISQMHSNGISAVGDVCNTAHGFAAKTASAIHFHHFMEVSGFVPQTANMRLATVEKLQQQLVDEFGGIFSTVPHAPYSASQTLLNLLANKHEAVSTIHHQESSAELEFVYGKTGPMLALFEQLGIGLDFFEPSGQTVLQWLLSFINAANRLLLVHNCMASAADIEILSAMNRAAPAEKLFLCLCPNANRYIGNPLPNLTQLVGSKLPICVGTDSLASNTALCILAELKTLQLHAPWLSSSQLLRWATINGAKALGIHLQYGHFASGTQPGILLISNINDLALGNSAVKRLY